MPPFASLREFQIFCQLHLVRRLAFHQQTASIWLKRLRFSRQLLLRKCLSTLRLEALNCSWWLSESGGHTGFLVQVVTVARATRPRKSFSSSVTLSCFRKTRQPTMVNSLVLRVFTLTGVFVMGKWSEPQESGSLAHSQLASRVAKLTSMAVHNTRPAQRMKAKGPLLRTCKFN